MYVALTKSFLEKNKEQALKTAKEEYGEMEDGADTYLWTDIPDGFHEIEFKEGQEEIHVGVECDLGYFTMDVPISLDIQLEIVKSLTKKLNKMKTVMEAMK